MTDTLDAPKFSQPPSDIAASPFMLDDVQFVPDGRFERGYRAGEPIGELVLDDNQYWFARKPAFEGEWQPMRCVHEARAFLISRVRGVA